MKSVNQESKPVDDLVFAGKGMPRELISEGIKQIHAVIGHATAYSNAVEALAARGSDLFVMVDGKPMSVADGAREIDRRFREEMKTRDARPARNPEVIYGVPEYVDAANLSPAETLSRPKRAKGVDEIHAAMKQYGRDPKEHTLLLADFTSRLCFDNGGRFFLRFKARMGRDRFEALPVAAAVELLLSEYSPERAKQPEAKPRPPRPRWADYPIPDNAFGGSSFWRYAELSDEAAARARASITAAVSAAGLDPESVVGQLWVLDLLARYRMSDGASFIVIKNREPPAQFLYGDRISRRAWPFDEAIKVLFSSESPELAIARENHEADEQNRVAAIRIRAEQVAKHAREAAEAERRRRLEAWKARPRAERAALILAHTNPTASIAELGKAIANEPEVPTALPPDDLDLKS
jgi:hypothetical protein